MTLAGSPWSVTWLTWAYLMTSSLQVHLQAPISLVTLPPWTDPSKPLEQDVLSTLSCCCPCPGDSQFRDYVSPSAHLELLCRGTCPHSAHHTSESSRVRLGTETCLTSELCAFHMPTLQTSSTACSRNRHQFPTEKMGNSFQLLYPLPEGWAHQLC